MSNAAAAVTDATFDEAVLKSDKPVVVDFWAEWCGPCRQVAPILDEIATQHADKITVLKLDIEANPEIAQRYNITAIPLISVFSGGELVKSIVGAKPKPHLLRELSDWIQ